MLVLIDKYIPFLAGVLEPYAEVRYLAPEDFTAAAVHDADALFVRTRTRVDAALLRGSKVRFVATATIGYDHIDTAWLESNGIAWTACPGCNAAAVCDYVHEALTECGLLSAGSVVGVVGVGHVGSLVAAMAEQEGCTVLLNDPPRGVGVSLQEIARSCDVITFHTPLTMEGDYPAWHLCSRSFLSLCKPGALIINAARGGVVDEAALLASAHPCVIDCWENEPDISHNLLLSPHTLLASYHIAGYSLEGKKNASQMCLDAFSAYFCLPDLFIDEKVVSLQRGLGDSARGWLGRITAQLKRQPSDFERLRKQYVLR